MTIFLSKEKINDLKNELITLTNDIFNHMKQDSDEDTIAYSYKDAAVSDVMIKPKIRRVKEIKNILKTVSILPEKIDSDSVKLGSKITLATKSETIKIRIVDPLESNPLQNRISYNSPLGKSLLNKKVNEKISFNKKIFKITSLE